MVPTDWVLKIHLGRCTDCPAVRLSRGEVAERGLSPLARQIFIGISIITVPKLGGAAYIALGDGRDDRCAHRRSLWMAGHSGAADDVSQR